MPNTTSFPEWLPFVGDSTETVRDYVESWVHAHFSPSDPVSDLGVLTSDLVDLLPYEPDDECTEATMSVLSEGLDEPKITVRKLVEEELDRAVDERFAELLAPHATVGVVDEWSYLETGDTEVPFGLAIALRAAYREAAREGHLDPFVSLYDEGKLEGHLQKHGAAQSG